MTLTANFNTLEKCLLQEFRPHHPSLSPSNNYACSGKPPYLHGQRSRRDSLTPVRNENFQCIAIFFNLLLYFLFLPK